MKPLTIIVDGIWRKPGRFKRWQADFRAAGIEAVEHAYDSSGFTALDELGRELARRIAEENRPVNLIGFSMGGLVVRAAHLADQTLPIRRAAFLNSPHRGSWLAHALPIAAVRQMRPGCKFLADLEAMHWDFPTIVVYSPADAMVVPGSYGRFNRAQKTICNHVPAHIWPVLSRSIRTQVIDFLAAESGDEYASLNSRPELRGAQSRSSGFR